MSSKFVGSRTLKILSISSWVSTEVTMILNMCRLKYWIVSVQVDDNQLYQNTCIINFENSRRNYYFQWWKPFKSGVDIARTNFRTTIYPMYIFLFRYLLIFCILSPLNYWIAYNFLCVRYHSSLDCHL